ncbi:hypothetical protein PINS_up005234 [Pythium insidiosum]|nr:hypothetical protein PINS_up005234 [Pythium insidiosum]
MGRHDGGEDGGADAGEYDSASSSSSSSEDNAVLLSKTLLQQKDRLRERLRQQQEEEAATAAAPRQQIQLERQQNQQEHQQNQQEHQQSNTPKSSVGKADQICGVCEQEGALVLCTGPCVSAYHLSCLPNADRSSEAQAWKCPSCAANTHVCFHCKQRGADASTATSTPATPTCGSAPGGAAEVLRPVLKCRALSCGKFYHQDCIAKLPLARIAGSRFICPLHTCAACEQSGAKKEPVRCTRCPVAYHTSCLPRSGVVNLPGKRIICPKHDAVMPPSLSKTAVSVAAPTQDAATGGSKTVNLPSLKRIVSTDVDSVAASSPRTEDNDDEQSETSSATEATAGGGSSSKKHAKKEKKEKKKKKKKRKKVKKKDKDKSVKAEDDDEVSKKESEKTERNEDDDEDDDDEDGAEEGEVDESEEKASAVIADPSPTKKPKESKEPEPSGTSQAADSVEPSDAIKSEPIEKQAQLERSSSTSSVSTALSRDAIVESPATVSQRLKARLVEVLGQSDDDLDSVASPVASLQDARQAEHAVPSLVKEESASPIVSSESTPTAVPSSSTGAEDSKRELAPAPADAQDYEHLSVAIPPVTDGNASGDGESQRDTDDAAQRNSLESIEADGAPETPSQPVKSRAASRTAAEAAKEKLSSGRSTPGGTAASAAATSTSTVGAHSGSKSKKKKKSKSSRSDGRRSSGAGLDIARQQSAGSIEDGDEGEEEDEDEAKWVQCDECRKWRIVPREIDLDAMPERWYCRMNTWRPDLASCSAPEEVAESKAGGGAGAASKASGSASRSRKRKPSAADAMVASQVPLVASKKARQQQQRAGKDDGVAASAADAGAGAAVAHAGVAGESEKPPKRDKDSKKRKLKLKLKEKYGEVKWVQCEHATCGKWRVVPLSIDFDLLPAVWYCHLNSWAPELASCAAPNPPEVEIYLSKSQSRKPSVSRPAKRHRGDSATATATGGGSAGQAGPQSAGKGSSKGGKGSTPTAHAHDHDAGAHANVSGGSSTAANAGPNGANPATAGGARVAGGGNSQDALSVRSSGDPIVRTAVATVLEWAQCEKCNKWRKLPAHIKSSTLPDKWYCSMNHWDPTRASCSVPQDEDQEPLDASPLPSSQNWYPMPGSRGAGGTGRVVLHVDDERRRRVPVEARQAELLGAAVREHGAAPQGVHVRVVDARVRVRGRDVSPRRPVQPQQHVHLSADDQQAHG